jgi:hypothetical protein
VDARRHNHGHHGGCDVAPIDLRAPAEQTRLQSFIWPEQQDRLERLRAAIAVVGAAPTTGSLELLTTLAADPAVTEEACSAMVSLVGRNVQGLSREQCRKALQTVVERSKDNRTKRGAQELLKKMQ